MDINDNVIKKHLVLCLLIFTAIKDNNNVINIINNRFINFNSYLFNFKNETIITKTMIAQIYLIERNNLLDILLNII